MGFGNIRGERVHRTRIGMMMALSPVRTIAMSASHATDECVSIKNLEGGENDH